MLSFGSTLSPRAGGGGMKLAFFCIFLHFQFWPEVAFSIFFLHLDATSAKEKVSHRVGSCIFRYFHAGDEGAGSFFLKKNATWGFYKVICFGSWLFFAFFLHFFAFFALHFLRVKLHFSLPPPFPLPRRSQFNPDNFFYTRASRYHRSILFYNSIANCHNTECQTAGDIDPVGRGAPSREHLGMNCPTFFWQKRAFFVLTKIKIKNTARFFYL